jgi:hypothetical protein
MTDPFIEGFGFKNDNNYMDKSYDEYHNLYDIYYDI